MKLLIERITDDGVQTIGRSYVMEDSFSEWNCPVLELPWKDNQRSISCIPPGNYKVIKHTSPTFGKCFWVQNVPGRSEILIHVGNYYTNTRGCILPGLDLKEMNGDGRMDVKDSGKAMKELLNLLPSKFELEIVNGHAITSN